MTGETEPRIEPPEDGADAAGAESAMDKLVAGSRVTRDVVMDDSRKLDQAEFARIRDRDTQRHADQA